MTPVYLKTPPSLCPLVEKMEEEHLKLFASPDQASSSLLSAAFLDRTQDERGSIFEKSQEHGEKADTPLPNGSYDHQELSVPSNHYVEEDGHNLQKVSLCHKVDEERSRTTNGSVQWMSSKMRLMKKVMNPNRLDADQSVRIMQNFQNIQQHVDCKINSPMNSNNSTRVCADCNTTTTPLWRSGPRGPKSLCNACGIRQRKARRAMAEAATNGLVVATDISSTKNKVHSKEKKSRTFHFGQHRNKGKVSDSSSHNEGKLSFKDFALSLRNSPDFGRVLPEDVAEAAILLMELSCGLVHG